MVLFSGPKWTDVTLEAFMSCPHNLANNRQVRMLANLSLSGCYKNDVTLPESRDCVMLKSAKRNLRQMAFFGLTEYQRETQYLFEKTFGLKFRRNFIQYNRTHASEIEITQQQKWRISEVNKLDLDLYQYAKTIFFQRLEKVLKEDQEGKDEDSKEAVVWEDVAHKKNEEFVNQMSRGNDYEEGDENDAEDDEEYNHRIIQQKSLFLIQNQNPVRNHNNLRFSKERRLN